MKGLGKKASLLALLAVVATALVGSAYTIWYDKLTATTTVSTSDLKGAILCATNLDNENLQWPAPPTTIEPFLEYPMASPLKDVATTLVTHQGSTVQQWVLQVGNTYPGYMFDCELHIANTGKVPWHVEVAQIKVTLPDGSVVYGACADGLCTYGDRDWHTPGLSQVYVEVADFEGCQVHSGRDKNASFFVGVNQSAQQGAQYKVELTYQVNQWNESSWNSCGNRKADLDGPVLPQLD